MKHHQLSKALSLLLTLALAFQLGLPALAAGTEEPAAPETGAALQDATPDEALPDEGDEGFEGDIIPPEEEVPPEVLPEPAAITVGRFSVPAAYQAEYDGAFRVYAASAANNGGKYGGSVIGNLIDGDVKTHWETGKPNSDNFQNTVTVTFAQAEELGSLVYYPRVQGAANKGFPTAFSVYASQTAAGEDFELVGSGTAPVAAGGTQISFAPTTFLRLRFVFEQANQNWAAAGELAFYRPDPLAAEVDNLFADGTMSALKPEYQSTDVLNAMLEKARANPDKTLLAKVETAIAIQTGAVDYAKDVITLEQRGDGVYHARKELLMSSYASNMLPTGYTAQPGDVVKIYVQADEDGPMPTVVFTQQMGRYGWWQKSYALKNGENIITAPNIYSNSWSVKTTPGGAIYFVNPYTAEEQGSAPRVRMEGVEDYPLFRDGDDVEAFLAELAAYQARYDADPAGTVDIVELYSERFVLNGNLKAAAPFLAGTADPQRTVDFHNDRVNEMLSFAGLDGSSPLNDIGTSRLMMRVMQPFAAGYAAGDHVGIQQSSVNLFFKGTLVGWIYTHETGHQLDIMGGKVPEVTNNMWANHIAVDVQGEYDRVHYDNILAYLGRDDYKDISFTPHNLGMWWQLHLLNENYWPEYQKAFRAGVAKDLGLTDRQRMAVVSSYVLGMDVVEHFERYGFITRTETVDAALAALGVPQRPENVKPWYLWTKATKDRTSAFEADYIPEITSVGRDGAKLRVTLSLDAAASAALLGYEVMEDGKVLGFTQNGTFTTAYFADDGQPHVYTARAYDLRMNRTEVSEPYAADLDAPVITVSASTLVPLHGDFDPLAAVTAADKDGNDLTANIQVVSSDVDTDVRGGYSVTYSVTDAAGRSAQRTVPVAVVSGFVYASDVEEQSAKVGWGEFRKDRNIQGNPIKLVKDGAQVPFEKGLGAHASSEIVYDLTDTGYTWFESYVGIDQAMKNTGANAKFQVFADGKLRYDSGAMQANTDMRYVAVDLAGVKELKLVTDSLGANGSDHTVWAGARFSVLDTAPVIHAQDVAYTSPDDVDFDAILADVTAYDVEDGDLTAAVSCDTDYTFGKTGAFTLSYSVTDSDGNTTRVEKRLVVVNSFVYVSDQEWKSAKVGWGKIQTDKSLNSNPIKLAAADGVRTYDKGLGVHAHSEVAYDLSGKDFYYFISDVGADHTAANGNTSVKFQVYVDGQLMAETGVMRKGMPAETLAVPLIGAKTLKLVVTDGGNGNANDHADWADAKFLIAVAEADKDALARAIVEAGSLDESVYTADSWAPLAEALAAARAVYDRRDASQAETDASLEELTAALDALVVYVDTGALEDLVALARSVASLENISPVNDRYDEEVQQIFVDNLLAACGEAEAALEGPDLTQEVADHWYAVVRYFLWDFNPDYTPGFTPGPAEG